MKMKALKILYFIEGTGGGAVTHVLDLANLLPRDRMQTLLIFFLNGPSVKKAEELNLDYKLIPWKFPFDFTLIWRLRQIIKAEAIDIVHTHTITGNFYSRIACLLSPIPVISITTVHSFLVDELKGTNRMTFKDLLRYKRERYTSCLTDHFVAVSNALQNKMVQDSIPQQKMLGSVLSQPTRNSSVQ